ncbi:putative polygalacturonate 4-alpha-galacturonosyltransferase [Helianthus annuus]|nr:putative polygalacturonate 4-alpha-galacturonosyltransferase [Helianthus annuus]
MVIAANAIKCVQMFDICAKGRYNIWRREYEGPNLDSTMKLMRVQIIMAKAYASILNAKNESGINDSLLKTL